MSDVNKIANPEQQQAVSLLKSYVFGFILTVALVIVSYLVAVNHWLVGSSLFFCLSILVVAQIVVQICSFLRLNDEKSDNGWSSLSFLFTLIIIAIIVIGNLWILYNLNVNMMM
jgi:cytochrome o ubiquinol oxidase subunit IV